MANTVELGIRVDSKKAVKSVNSFSKKTISSLSKVGRSFSLLNTAIVGIGTVLAGRQIVRGLSAITDAAAIQEDAINSLNTAIFTSGKAINSLSFQKFASGLQSITKFGDEAILESAALIQSLGQLEQEGLEGATKAALDMSAALKIDLASAATLLGKAATGEIGTLSRYGVIVKRGADNAETFANVLDTLNSKFGGAAERAVRTYSGATDQLKNTMGDLNEELGFTITRNPVVIKSISILEKTFSGIIGVVKENQDGIANFVAKALKGVVSFIPKVIKGLKFVVNGFQGIGLAATVGKALVADFVLSLLEFDIVRGSLDGVRKLFLRLDQAIVDLARKFLKLADLLPGNSFLLKKIGIDLEETIAGLKVVSDEFEDVISEDVSQGVIDRLEKIKESGLDAGEKVAEAFKPVNAAFDFAAEEAQKAADKINAITIKPTVLPAPTQDETADSTEPGFFDFSRITGNVSDSIAAATCEGFEQGSDAAKLVKTLQPFSDGVAGAMIDGAKTASKVMTQVFATGIDAFIPGLGTALKPILQAAQQDPEVLREQISAFVVGLVEAADAIVIGLVEAMPLIVETLIDVLITQGGIVRIAIAFAKALALELPQALVKAVIASFSRIRFIDMERTWQRFIDDWKESWRAKPEWIGDLQKRLNTTPSWVKNISIKTPPWIDRLVDAIESLTGALNVTDSSGNVGGELGKFGEGVKQFASDPVGYVGARTGLFAEGGQVPPNFPNDTFPARLTSNETVISPGLTDQLQGFLDGQSEGQAMNIVLELNEEVLAEAILNLDRRNLRVAV